MGKLVLIDGHSILNRAFYGVPDLTNSEGLHTNAVYGFLNIMFKILDEEKADHLAVAFDRKEPTFRHKMYAEYKGTRKPMPEELREQVPLMKEVLSSMGIPILTLAGFEADDILGTVAKRNQANGVEVSVISGDRDLLQLADEKIKIRIPKTSRGTTEIHDYYPEDVKREYQVTPLEFIDVKALMGDASDNIPGVPSIGEKTATALIVAYGSIENAYAHLDEVKPPRARKALEEHYDMAQMSKELAAICIDCPIAFSYEEAEIGNLYTQEAYQYMKRLEFKSMVARFDADAMGDAKLEDGFIRITGKKDAEKWLKQVREAVSGSAGKRAGLQIFTGDKVEKEEQLSFFFGADGQVSQGGPFGAHHSGQGAEPEYTEVSGISLSLGETGTVCILAGEEISGKWLISQARELILQAGFGRVWVPDLKKLLPLLGLDYGSPALDGGVAAYLLNPLKDTYEYDDLARDYLGLTLPSEKDLLGKIPVGKALQSGEEKAAACACYMAFAVQKAGSVLEESLKKTGMWELFLDIEMPLIYSLFHMEQTGVKVQREALKEYGDKLKVRIAELEKQIYEDCGETFNINSPKQLGEILFDKMQLKGGKKTKTGYSTAADVLEKLAPEVPVVQKILDYRQITKLNSTYAEGLAGYIGTDERIHGTFNQTITATGRISSTEPNLQNIPVRMELGREIRKVFVPEEGYVFVDADYSQIELRILASMSADERLIDAYNSAQDIHAITASQVFHIPLDEVTPLQRRNAKAVNFGIVYGISAFGLGEGLSVSRKEAQEYINQYFETYPGVKEYLDRLVKEGKEQGYVTTLYGRRRPIPELKSANFMQRSFGERVAMNSPIQGTAADIMKIAMIGVDQELRSRKMKSRIVLQVHDELLIETWEEEKELVKAILEDKMKHASRLKVSLEVEANEGANWFDAH
ncbi:MAG: DNA polymerase I [Lachnospiraceae bacterium]|nr:DNA polymerase I [Lachnospiraceae bacterium]